MQITSGSVKYSRVKKDDDYGIKREAEAVLAFTVNEGEGAEAALEHGFKIAVNYVHKTLGFSTEAPVVPVLAAQPASAKEAGSPSPTPSAPAASPVLNDKERLAAEVVQAATPVAAEPPKRGRPAAKKPEPPAQTDLEDILGTETRGEEAPAPAVSDKDLLDKVTRKNATLKQPPKIHALVDKFTGGKPKTMKDIPAEKRWEFIRELEALT